MALSKPIPTPFGVTATYHNIATLQTYYREACCDVVLASYVDESARRAGAQPLGTLPTIRLPLAEFPGSAEPARAEVYAMLMASPEWEEAAVA